jgi:hypothetical protein
MIGWFNLLDSHVFIPHLFGLVQSLRNDHISLQYHVIVDDIFGTVFTEGQTTEEIDRICESLFAGNRECFVVEEYDIDGALIYEPPPLDEV